MNYTQVRMINFMNNIGLNYNVVHEEKQIRIELFKSNGDYKWNFTIANDDECGIIVGPFYSDKFIEVTTDMAFEVIAGFNRKFK